MMRPQHSRKCLLGILAALAVLAGGNSCTKRYITDPVADSIYLGRIPYTIQNNYTYTNFYSALQQTGWLDTLYGPGPYTVLLANNDAYLDYYRSFTAGDVGTLGTYVAAQINNGMSLRASVGYDLVKGQVSFRSMPLGMNQVLTSVTGSPVFVTRYLSGGDTLTTVDGEQVISEDNPATNGLIQVISTAVPNFVVYPTVMQQIESDTNLTYFATALHRCGLDTLLDGAGPYTVLAPYNGAFQSTYNGSIPNLSSLDSIGAADPVKLAAVLRYNILPGRYYVNDFMRLLTTDTLNLTMLNGEAMKFTNTYYPYSPILFLGGYEQPTFNGNGNLLAGLAGATIYDESNFTQAYYYRNGGDLTTGNGVVQTTSGLLIP